MFSKTECVGRLCPPSLEEINVSGYVKSVILVPYILTDKGYYVQTFDGELLKSECGDKKPFDCGEYALEILSVLNPSDSANVTHIFFVGHAKPEEMLIFIKLDKKSGNGFIKVMPNMNLEYSWQIEYVLGSNLERFILKGKDVAIHHILKRLEGKDLINFCKTSNLKKECNDYMFLILKDIDLDLVRTDLNVNWMSIYDILFQNNFNFNIALKSAAVLEDKKTIDYLIEKGAKEMSYGLEGGIEKKNRDMINFFIKKGAQLNHGLFYSAKLGDRQLVDFFIKKGSGAWPEGLNGAAYNGNIDLVNFFIKEVNDIPYIWSDAMSWAAKGGHKNLVEFFIKKMGGKEYSVNDGMYAAAQGGNKDIVDLFIKKGAKSWKIGMRGAIEGNHKNLIDFFIAKGFKNWEEGMNHAARKGNKYLVNFFIGKMAQPPDEWEQGLRYAIEAQNIDLVKFFIEKGANIGHLDLLTNNVLISKILREKKAQIEKDRLRRAAIEEAPQPILDPDEMPIEERILPRIPWLGEN
jgi:hypothetical protein